jgi:hypothetical protein
MNNKLSNTFIKHSNACFQTQKRFMNRFQNFWKLPILWNCLHQPGHNIIWKIIKIFEEFLKNVFLKFPSKQIPKASNFNLCYPICTLVWTTKFSIYNCYAYNKTFDRIGKLTHITSNMGEQWRSS